MKITAFLAKSCGLEEVAGGEGSQPLAPSQESGTRLGAATGGRAKRQDSSGVHQPVIHSVRDTDTVHGGDFTFRGLWRAP